MNRGMNGSEMQKNNRTLVFKTLLECGAMTRTELASEIGLQKATITNIVNEFIEMGIIGTDGDAASGRRGENICLKLNGIYIMSIGITRKDYQIAIYSLDGKRVDHIRYQFKQHTDIRIIMKKLKESAVGQQSKFGRKNFAGISLAVPGPYIIRRKTEERETFQVSEFEELSQINIRSELEEALGLPVLMKHDAKLGAYAEWRNAKEVREDKNASLIIIRSRGFGIGAGLVINGKIVEGQVGIAGEIGHMGIQYNSRRTQKEMTGTFEYCAGTDSAMRYVLERLYEYPDSALQEESTYKDVVDAYMDNDPLAVYAINKMAWMLGYGIANIIYIINPDCIILGPDYPETDAFLEEVKRVVREFVHPLVGDSISIRYSRLSEDSFLFGGYYYVLESLFKDNTILEKIQRTID